mmetsp:Transcript_57400/g.159762  ORF Transcript_57400/g.159762 Transcript_57400/m.159762 type:complete len:250 (+) Transcript_57400:2762-3511(+)
MRLSRPAHEHRTPLLPNAPASPRNSCEPSPGAAASRESLLPRKHREKAAKWPPRCHRRRRCLCHHARPRYRKKRWICFPSQRQPAAKARPGLPRPRRWCCPCRRTAGSWRGKNVSSASCASAAAYANGPHRPRHCSSQPRCQGHLRYSTTATARRTGHRTVATTVSDVRLRSRACSAPTPRRQLLSSSASEIVRAAACAVATPSTQAAVSPGAPCRQPALIAVAAPPRLPWLPNLRSWHGSERRLSKNA